MEELTSGNFLPHGYCLVWEPRLMLLHIISDTLISLAYYSIPIALVYFVTTRQDLVYTWMFKLFGAFIFACGTTHLMSVITVWEPLYWLDGWIKAGTAAVSVATAVLLWPLIPRVLKLPSPAQLEQANKLLRQEIVERKQAQEALQQIRDKLDERVKERTAELRDVNQALRESEEKYHKLYDTAPDMFVSVDPKSAKISQCNQALVTNLGYSKDEIIGRSVFDLYHPDCMPQVKQVFETFVNNGAVHNAELQLKRKEGSKIDVILNVSVVRDDQGNILYSSSILRDITDRKRVEAALQESEAFATKILATAINGIYIYDLKQGLNVYLNPQYTRLTGHSLESLNAMTPEEFFGLFHPDDRQQISVHMQKVSQASDDDILEIEYRFKTHADRWMWCLSWDSVFERDEGGNVKQFMGTFIDITERKQSEEALIQKAEELSRSNAELEQFAYVASHDLQEPLRSVAGYLQLLERRYRGQLDADADKYIERSVAAANRMQSLINDLLAYSRISTHGKTFKPIDCKVVLERVLDNLARAIEESNAEISYDSLPTIEADYGQLIQLLQNLISNAIKFHSDRPPIIHVGVERRDDAWLFSITDNGIGIDPKYAERIFLVFQRLHSRRAYMGTGIGLAICKKIVERHTGRIWVEPTPGQGATFLFTIPHRKEILP